MKYKKGMNFSQLKKGDIIEDVPIDHEILQEYENYIEVRRNRPKWLARIQEMKDGYPF